jgi:hypothetical protein
MQQLHKELKEDNEDQQDCYMQELLERYEEEKHLQEQGYNDRIEAWIIVAIRSFAVLKAITPQILREAFQLDY